MRWDGLGADLAFQPGVNEALTANRIQSELPNGAYQVGSASNANQSTRLFYGLTIAGDSGEFYQGQYTGDGNNNRQITAAGFSPHLTIIRSTSTAPQNGVFRISSMPDTNSSQWAAAALNTDCILREIATGVELGVNALVNTNGVTYEIVMMRFDSSQGEVFSYSGNSTDGTNISLSGSFIPKVIIIKGDGATEPIHRTDQFVGDNSQGFGSATIQAANQIQSMGPGTFQLGDSANTNATGSTYYGIAFADEVTTFPYLVGVGTLTSAGGAITPPFPTGDSPRVNDLMVTFIETANQTQSAPTGWNEFPNSPQGTGTAGSTTATSLQIFWRRFQSGDTAPAYSGAANHKVGQVLVFRNVRTTGNPYDATNGDVLTPADTAVTIPGVTTSVADCLILSIASSGFDDVAPQFSGWTNANLANLYEVIDSFAIAGNGGGFGMASGELAAAGPTGNTTATLANTFTQGRIMIAITNTSAAPGGSPPMRMLLGVGT